MPRKGCIVSYDDLSKKQAEVYRYLLSETRAKGYPPTVREIMNGLNRTSTSTIHAHLSTLQDKGYIIRDANKPRAIEFPRETSDYLGPASDVGEIIAIPVIGQVAAGAPILAEENIVDTLPYPASFVNGTSFMLKVNGDSMIEAGIFDGDLVVVRQQETANNGDVVVAIIDDEATVKRFYREADAIRLQPENSQYEPIRCTDEVRIAGKVVGLIRQVV
ncbi:MAG: transcriptional repressor LexA [Coriobacteriia bacterium]|nr:transcriptional repressor LexA [Coriobacteriia bacterium]